MGRNPQSLDSRAAPGSVTIVLPLPPGKNSENRCHWAGRRRDRNRWKAEAELAWAAAGRARFGKCHCVLHFYCKNIRDEDNLMSLAVKAILDGLKGRLFTDDSPEYLKQEVEQTIDRKNPRLEIVARVAR